MNYTANKSPSCSRISPPEGIPQETRETGLEKKDLNKSPDEKPAND
jgi:hypothetical protein